MSYKMLVVGRVRCINRGTKQFFDRDFWLDLSTLQENERERVEEAIKKTVGPAEFVAIRSLFQQGRWPAFGSGQEYAAMKAFALSEYFEDEAGNPLDQIGLAQIVTGQENPILLTGNLVRPHRRYGDESPHHSEQWQNNRTMCR